MQGGGYKNLSPSKGLAYAAVACAALLGGQYVFSFITGAEVVTLIFVCFAYVFGIRRSVTLAVAFSLLRCFIFGFYPNVIILYLLYYPLLCVIFGGAGHIGREVYESCPAYLAVAVNALLSGVCVACATAYALDLIKVSGVYRATAYALLWTVFALCLALCLAFDGLLIAKKAYGKNTAQALETIAVASLAVVCTACFTLLDDIITPAVLGYTRLAAVAYFYASFTAMLPQTVCAAVSVSTLFTPLTSAMRRALNK